MFLCKSCDKEFKSRDLHIVKEQLYVRNKERIHFFSCISNNLMKMVRIPDSDLASLHTITCKEMEAFGWHSETWPAQKTDNPKHIWIPSKMNVTNAMSKPLL